MNFYKPESHIAKPSEGEVKNEGVFQSFQLSFMYRLPLTKLPTLKPKAPTKLGKP